MREFNLIGQLAGYRFGITHDLVRDNGEPYLERWILWSGLTLLSPIEASISETTKRFDVTRWPSNCG